MTTVEEIVLGLKEVFGDDADIVTDIRSDIEIYILKSFMTYREMKRLIALGEQLKDFTIMVWSDSDYRFKVSVTSK